MIQLSGAFFFIIIAPATMFSGSIIVQLGNLLLSSKEHEAK